MTETVILPDSGAVAAAAAERWARLAAESIEARGRFMVALSGGATPRPLYRLLASEPYRSSLPWSRTGIFFTDERRVPQDHPDSNYRMVRETLLADVPVAPSQVFPLKGEGLISDVQKSGRNMLEEVFRLQRKEWPRFDLVLLGLGEDGHFASIFPGTRALTDNSMPVMVIEVPSIKAERVTLTLPVINNARHLMFLVTGEKKAEAVEAALQGPNRISAIPTKALKPVDGDIVWLIDEAAASRLK